ncbi:protein TonB-like [Physella acuta]|uniref:protein TonB-like n=1 Tax=Physella acuta TaxID=109671 RepID=UPI0027DBF2E7|nr:protein TonB-like [Physella acuta]
MVTFTIIQMMVMMFFSLCRAQDGCVAYDSAKFAVEQVTVGSHYGCFEASVRRNQSYAYTYQGGVCKITVLFNPNNISVDPKWATGFVICTNDPSHCAAYSSFTAASSFISTHALNLRSPPKRQPPKRQPHKRQPPKRQPPKRNSPKRQPPKRQPPKRQPPKRQPPKRNSPNRQPLKQQPHKKQPLLLLKRQE